MVNSLHTREWSICIKAAPYQFKMEPQIIKFYALSVSNIILFYSSISMSLFERLGGEGAVSAVVDKFYELMLQDQRVSHFYESADMGKLKCRQKDFITLVTGGPNHYEGTDMKTAHCKLNISLQDFDVTWENLEKALQHFTVEHALVDELKAIFYSVQEEVVKSLPTAAEFKANDGNKIESVSASKCPFSGKSPREGEENCPFKLRNNPYMKYYY